MDLFFDNEFKNLLPSLTETERVNLESDLKEKGNLDPIIVWKEKQIVIDGHNRYDICQKYNIPLKPPTEISFPDKNSVKVWMITHQIGKRNLNNYQRSVMALKLEELLKPIAQQSYKENVGRPQKSQQNSATINHFETRKEIAKVAHVSHDTISKVKTIEAKATPEQKAALSSGNKSINQVYIAVRREETKHQVKATVWPTGKYRIIYADPPWQYGNTMPDYTTQPDDHYPLMSIEQLCLLPVKDISLDDSVLFLWVTSPILEDSFKVINAWGFKYKASFIWDKVKHNMGHYNSVRHELLLIAVKGSCQPDEAKLYDSVQTIERNGHSEKPEIFREIINTIYPHGPRVELFSRKKVDGWEVYGNQIS